MKKLILFLSMLFTLNLGMYGYNPDERLYVEQFDTVVCNVPARIRCEYSTEYSICIKGDTYLYSYEIKNHTLFVNPVFKNEDIQKLDPDSLYLIIKHPYPNKLLSELKIDRSKFMKNKAVIKKN